MDDSRIQGTAALPGTKSAGPSPRRLSTAEPMVMLEIADHEPKLELDLPTPPVRAREPQRESARFERASPSVPLEAPVAPALLRPAPAEDARPIVSAFAGRNIGPRFDAPPVLEFYSPTILMLWMGAGILFLVLGLTQLPIVSDLFGRHYAFLGAQLAVLSVMLGGSLLAIGVRYHNTRGEGDSDWLSLGRILPLGASAIGLVLVVALVRGKAPTSEPEGPPGLYQPGFRRAFVESLKVSFSDATVDVVEVPSADPALAGSTLRFKTERCSQQFVDSFGQEPAMRIGLRKSGIRRVACIGTEPGDQPAAENTLW